MATQLGFTTISKEEEEEVPMKGKSIDRRVTAIMGRHMKGDDYAQRHFSLSVSQLSGLPHCSLGDTTSPVKDKTHL